MLTALGDVDHRVAGLNAGADDYLPKPVAFEELLAHLRAVLTDVEDLSEMVKSLLQLSRDEKSEVRAPDREIELHLTGNMEHFVWAINGVEYCEAAAHRYDYC